MKMFSKEEAISFYHSDKWKELTDQELASFQLYQDFLCVPFNEFHKSVEAALGRPVFTHEFGINRQGLKDELAGKIKAPSFEQVISLLPQEKVLVVEKI